MASRETVIDAWKDALAGDPVSAFGGVLICNRPIDAATAAEVNKIFFEVIIAPDYTPEAIGILEQKKNRIILRQKAPLTTTRQFRSVLNGALVQERDLKHETPEDLRLVTTTPVDNSRVEDLLFANKLVKHCKSNAIVLAKNKQLCAAGVGQTSRVDALRQAIEKAHTFKFDLNGAVMASDAFFPFADCVEIAHKAGIDAVIQPGGSIRDNDSIQYCDENGIAMVMTGFRHFKSDTKMRLFSLTKEIAIDLGTANTVIIHNDKIVIDEPSIVALDRRTDKLIAVGKEAQLMLGRENEQIRTVRPLRQGVIADFNAAELMIRGLIKKASSKSNWFSPSLRMVVGIPSGSTGVEIRAVRDSSEHAGGRDVYMIYEPMAAALGIGLDVEAPEGNMIVDIGGGTTEIAVISLGGIVSNRSIQIAGDDLTEDIQGHMRRAHNVRVGERTAEQIKMNVGSALTELENPPEDYIVHGPNQMTALPMEIPVSYQEISHCIEKSVTKIETAVLGALEQPPPELYADIVRNGIWLAGGGALLRGLDKRLTDKIGIQFHVAEDPLLCVAKGTGVALKNIDNFSFLIR